MSNFSSNPFNFQPDVYLFPEDFNLDYSTKLRQYLNDIAIGLNAKENGFYIDNETPTAGLFIPTFSNTTAQNINYRPMFRLVVDCGALPNTSTKSVAHGLTTTQTYSIVKIYGGATDPGASTLTEALPLPFASPTLSDNISVTMDATNINITTGSDRTAYTRSYVVIEYIKEV